MKKSAVLSASFILLAILIFGYYNTFIKEEPEYLLLEIPNPQFSEVSPYSTDYASSEEFSKFVWHDSKHVHFIWRMYSHIYLGDEGFHTIADIENYYGENIMSRGWDEVPSRICDPYMSEFMPNATYLAYSYPTKFYAKPIACLAVWPEFENGDRMLVLIKTINPSKNVLSDWD